MTPLAIDLAARGIAAWNVEYRRVGQEGGGWPGTLEDVAAAVDRLRNRRRGRRGAGRHLRPLGRWPPRALARGATAHPGRACPGPIPPSRRSAAVAQAGVCDLERARRDDLGGGAVEGLLGPSDAARDAAASPAALAPLGVPQLLVHGDADDIVPAVAEPRPRLARPRRRARRARRRRPLRGDRAGESRLGCGARPARRVSRRLKRGGAAGAAPPLPSSRCSCRLRRGTAARRRSSGRPGPA